MATEIGTLYLSLAASTAGMQKDISRTFGDVESQADKSGKRAGSSLGSSLSNSLKVVSGAVVGVGAAVAGLALGGGISRALSIENAQAKLTGLGHDAASVSGIMANALASVKGTAFGLGDAATVAASLTASGVKQGSELEGVLKTVADTATISGRSLTDVGAIFGSVAARGKLGGDDLLQLTSAGVPALQFLAAQTGKTTQQVSDMVSKGQIDFNTFAAAMQAGLGGAALASGSTFTGALANVRGALSRLGEVVDTPVLENLRLIFGAAIPVIDAMTERLKPLVSALADRVTPVVERVSQSFAQVAASGSLFDALGEKIKSFAPALLPLAGLVVGLGSGGLAGLAGSLLGPFSGLAKLLPVISGPLGLVLGAVAALVAASPELRSAIAGIFSPASGLSDVMSGLAPVLTQLAPVVVQIAQTIGSALGQAITAIFPSLVNLAAVLGGALAQILPVVAGAISTLVSALAPLIPVLISALLPAFDALTPVIGLLAGLFAQLVPILVAAILPVITALAPIITQLVTAFLPLVQAVLPILASILAVVVPIVGQLLQAFMPLISTVLELIQPLLQLIGPVLGLLMPILTTLINVGLMGVKVAFAFLIPVIQSVVKTISGVLTPVIQGITGVLGGVIDFITGVFSGNWEKAWSGVVKVFTSIWNGITGVVKGVMNSAIDLINGIIQGINDVATKVKDGTGGAVNLTIGKIPKLADGGTILPRPGGTLAVLAEAGRAESVVDTGKLNALLDVALAGGGASGASQNNYFTGWQGDPTLAIRAAGREFHRSFG